MNIRLFAACILSACALIAIAEVAEPTEKELAEKLLIAMDVPQTTDQLTKIMKDMVPLQMKQMGAPDELINESNQHMKTMMDFIMKEVGWVAMKTDYINLYAEVFSKEEMEGAIAFYSSDIGKAFIKKQPELMQRSMQISQKRMMDIMPKLSEKAKELADTMNREKNKQNKTD